MRRHARTIGATLLLALIGCAQAGCYKRVVRQSEFSTESDEVWEANVSDEPSWIDKTESFMWGDPAPEDKKKRK